MKANFVFLTLIISLAFPAFSLADTATTDLRDDPTIGARFTATLDPAELRAKAESGEPLALPTIEGPISVRLLPEGQPALVIDTAPDGSRTETTYRPNVWKIIPAEGSLLPGLGSSSTPSVSGSVLLRDDLLKAKLNTIHGVTMIEPTEDYAPGDVAIEYVVYRPGDKPRPEGSVDGFEAGHSHSALQPSLPRQGEFPASHTVYRTLTVYVDTGFRNQYGGLTWPDQVSFIMSMVNGRMADAKLQYSLITMVYDPGFDTSSETTSWNRITSISKLGNDVAGAFVYRDWDGCTIGRGYQPGDRMHIQHQPDACHSWVTPVNDYDRYYLSTHEFAHNQNADHGYADLWWSFHTHRDITQESAWYHYHDYISAGNLVRMKTHLGTNH